MNFSQAAAQYDQHAKLQEKIRKQAVMLAVDYFPKKAMVLDIGCGTAEFALENKETAPPFL